MIKGAGISKQHLIFVIGFLFSVFSISRYWLLGFKFEILLELTLGLILMIAAGFISSTKNAPKITPVYNRRDLIVVGILIVVFAPLYMYDVHNTPRQINPDEPTISHISEITSLQPNIDLLGPGVYYGLPNLIFWVMGKTATAMGGVSLTNMRLVNAGVGVLIVATSYILFRQFLKFPAALLACFVIGVNHSLFFISRMAMRDNTALLLELVSLLFLYVGWRKKHFGWTMLGGVMSGLAFYSYYAGRVTVAIWILFVATWLILHKFKGWKQVAKLSGVALAGFTVTVAPLFIANIKSLDNSSYANLQVMWTEYGRQAQQQWVSAPDESSAIRTNIKRGLLSLNRPYADGVNVYHHTGYGFVDVFTGALIWVGIITILLGWRKRWPPSDADLLMLIGFFVIWLSLALIFYKAPDYTRMLVILPFVGYLVSKSVTYVGKLASSRFIPIFIYFFVALVITIANALIIKDYIRDGQKFGNALGDTLRFEEKNSTSVASWYYAPAGINTYIDVGDYSDARYWLNYAIGKQQTLNIIEPQQLRALNFSPPNPSVTSYLLTNDSIWQEVRSDFGRTYNVKSQTALTPDGKIIAVKFYAK